MDILRWAEVFGYAGPEAKPNPNIRDKERQILDPIWRLGKDEISESYFILCAKKDPDLYGTIKHEVAHSLYRLNPNYRRKCLDIYKCIPSDEKKQIHKFLRDNHYNSYMYPDETQAYFSAGGGCGWPISKFSCYRPYLRNFNHHISLPQHEIIKNKLNTFYPFK